MLKGQWENLDDGHVRGWVLDPDNIEVPVHVRVEVNGKLVASTDAVLSRPDLGARFGSDLHGFNIDVSIALRPGFNKLRVSAPGVDFAFDQPERSLFHIPTDGAFGAKVRHDPRIYLYESQFKRDIQARIPLHSEDGDQRLAKVLGETQVVFILFTNRSGSNLVTDMLTTLGVGGGVTHEPFLSSVVQNEVAKHHYTSVSDYLASTIETYRRNGTVYLKIGWDALSYLSSEGVLAGWLHNSHFIWTRRHDKLMQAISYAKAMRTGVFFERGDAAVSPPSFRDMWEGEKSLTEIAGFHRYFYEADARLALFQDLLKLPYEEVWYEDMADDIGAVFERVRNFVEARLGINNGASTFVSKLRKHESTDNEKIKELYLQMLQLSAIGR